MDLIKGHLKANDFEPNANEISGVEVGALKCWSFKVMAGPKVEETVRVVRELIWQEDDLMLNSRRPTLVGPQTPAEEAINRVLGQIMGGCRNLLADNLTPFGSRSLCGTTAR